MDASRPKRQRAGAYPDTPEQQRVKADVNARLCEAVALAGIAAPTHNKPWALVLDAPSLLSSRALVAAGLVPPDRLLVPCALDRAAMREAVDEAPELRGLVLVPEYTGKLLARTLDPEQLAFTFLDWMCTLNGSTPVRPKAELTTALERGVFAPSAVLAFTVHIARSVFDPESAVDEAVAFVETAAVPTRYRPRAVLRFWYENLESRLLVVAFKLDSK